MVLKIDIPVDVSDMQQHPPEIAALAGLWPADVKRVLEIGVMWGGTLRHWSKLAPSARVLGIDADTSNLRWRPDGKRVQVWEADSHAIETQDRVLNWLAGDDLDVLFIDGDHTPQGVRDDWEMYSPLVRAGGIIIFHDVGVSSHLGWRDWWNELAASEASVEVRVDGPGLDDPDVRFGIGVIFKGGWN